MTPEEFIKSMQFLKKAMPTCKLETQDKNVMMLYYAKARTMDAKQFNKLIGWYAINKEFPPSTIVQLTDAYKEIFSAQYPSENEIYSMLLDIVEQGLATDPYKAEKDMLPLFKHRISSGQWNDMRNDYDAIKMQAKRLHKITQEESKVKATMFLQGKIPLPLTDSGELITYKDEVRGVKDSNTKQLSDALDDAIALVRG